MYVHAQVRALVRHVRQVLLLHLPTVLGVTFFLIYIYIYIYIYICIYIYSLGSGMRICRRPFSQHQPSPFESTSTHSPPAQSVNINSSGEHRGSTVNISKVNAVGNHDAVLLELPSRDADQVVERIWHTHDSQGQILALASAFFNHEGLPRDHVWAGCGACG